MAFAGQTAYALLLNEVLGEVRIQVSQLVIGGRACDTNQRPRATYTDRIATKFLCSWTCRSREHFTSSSLIAALAEYTCERHVSTCLTSRRLAHNSSRRTSRAWTQLMR